MFIKSGVSNEKVLTLCLFSILVSCSSDNTNPSAVVEQEPEIKKIIERTSGNDFENNLILKAEAIYPDRDSVLAVIEPDLKENIPDTGLWYFGNVSRILIPYAITQGAISYYSSLIDSIKINKGFKYYLSANFEYKSKIEFKETYTFTGTDTYNNPLPSVQFNRVYVVEMSLEWDHVCGNECGLWFSHKRIVVFDQSGNLLNVFYDGIIPIAVA